MKKKIVSFISKRMEVIDLRVKDIDFAIMMYEHDAWGSSAFKNIQTINGLEKEKKAIMRRHDFWQLAKKLLT